MEINLHKWQNQNKTELHNNESYQVIKNDIARYVSCVLEAI